MSQERMQRSAVPLRQMGEPRIIRFPEAERSLDSPRVPEVADSALTEDRKGRYLEYGREILRKEGEAILDRRHELDDDFCRAVSILLDCSGSVVVAGVGKAGHVGRKISATLASNGTPSWFLSPSEAIHGDLGCLHAGDVLLILSYSGETEEITRLLPWLARHSATVVSITATKENTLARYSSAVVATGILAEADEHNLAPSTSSTVMLALGDALALTVSHARGFRPEDFAAFHPGGSLGRKLALVEEYMRPLKQCRISSEDKSIREIFVESHLPGRRPGAILLVDVRGRLAGIFTDSDLAKMFEQNDCDVLDRRVGDVMTRSPKVVRCGTRMPLAIAIMSEKKISELPVLDEDDIPVGMLDITDLVAFGIEDGGR